MGYLYELIRDDIEKLNEYRKLEVEDFNKAKNFNMLFEAESHRYKVNVLLDAISYTIRNNKGDKAFEDIIDSITLSAPGKYNVYSGKITVGNNLQITESDIVVNNRSVIEPASVTNPGRVILTRADGATFYDDAASYDTDVNDVPITLTASQIKAMIDKAIEESGGGGGSRYNTISTDPINADT
jgi:hypothetical protein